MADKENRYIKLSRQDVSAGVEQKGSLSYLSWAYCWNLVSEHDPEANFYFADPVWYPDESVMVKAVMTIDGKQMEQTLPVMDNRNRSIKNPDSRAISDAQQRAMVKCAALYGVGISLYLGESLSNVVAETPYQKSKAFAEAGDFMGLHEYTKGLSEKDQIDAFNDAEPGTKTDWKNQHRALMRQAESLLSECAESIASAHESDDSVLCEEVIGELSTYERKAVAGRLTPEQLEFVKAARSAA
jgi:hypothetical protein